MKDEFTSNLNFLATLLHVVNLHRTKSYPYDLKCTKIAPPQTPLEELTTFYIPIVEEGGVEDEFTSNLNFLATPLW